MSVKNDPGVEQPLAAALRAAESTPDSDDAWDHLESLAEGQQEPDEVAALYRDILRRSLPAGLRAHLAERAVRFHEEWYGDQQQAITDLLLQILERDPGARWALDRLTVTLTASEAWDELLDVYDRVLINTASDEIRREILAEAAHVAKEFADKPDLAADYLLAQVAIDSDNKKLASTVERLLERLGRFVDLVGLWEGQLAQLSASDARDLRVKIAGVYITRLDKPVPALIELQVVLGEVPSYPSACAELERLMGLDTAPIDLRRKAFKLLRQAYDSASRGDDVVRLIKAARDFSDSDEERALLRDLGNRLAVSGDDAGALSAYSDLLRLTPSDSEARKQLRQIATRAKRHDLHAAALLSAAQATQGGMRLTLLLDAAQLRREALGDVDGALDLYREILSSADVDPSTASIAAHNLASLLRQEDQREERLQVLERLADLEGAPAIRQSILGEAAHLAEALGKRERALAIWSHRLDCDDDDVEAMSAVIRLLETLERWQELVAALLRRAAAPVIKLQQRADLLKAAELQAFRLGNIDGAIELLLSVREDFGEDPEVLRALDRQLTACARFDELAALLERSAGQSASHTGWLYVRAAELHLRDLDDKESATRLYAEALSLDPERKEARDGLREVLSDETCRALAVRALLTAFQRVDDWSGVLELIEPRIALATDDYDRAGLLAEAARISERRGDDPVGARSMFARALISDPGDVTHEHELRRLTQATDAWKEFTETLATAAVRAAEAPARAAQLWFARGKALAEHLGDIAEAASSFAEAAKRAPDHLEYQDATARQAAHAGRWQIAANAAVKALRGHQRHDTSLLEEIAKAAKREHAWKALADAMQAAADEFGERLTPQSARQLELAIADWYERCGEDDAAIAATRKASLRDPNDLDVLRSLAHRLRTRTPVERIDNLLRIDALAISDLDPLREAAAMAFASDDEELVRNTLYRLYRKAARMWARDEVATGVIQPGDAALWALDEVTQRSAADLSARLLLDGATLPVSPDKARDLRRQAAELLAGVDQRARAIDLYFGIISEGDESLADILRLADLCSEEGRTAELLELRNRELGHTEDPDRRLELRLEIARLAGELETRDSRIGALKSNLSERTGHRKTLEILSTILCERGRFAELADILEAQARKLTAEGSRERAATLWTEAAQLAEDALGDQLRAIRAYTEVAELAPNTKAIDALARLHLQRDEAAEAAVWLKRRLADAASNERVAILLKLGRTLIAAGEEQEATTTLQTAFAEAPRNAEVRKLLLGLLRGQGDAMALADTLALAAKHVTDTTTVLAYARESAALYQGEIGAPELAVPVLERALAIAENDRGLKMMLARGLLSNGHLPQAKHLLAELIESFGRRRSAERAEIHLLLSQVLHADGEIAPAIDQLEAASSMDPGNIAILRSLAELARQSGQLARSERAYRTLLVNLRRADSTALAEIGPAEVLLRLGRIAKERGQDDKANELVESAIDALAESDAEAPRLQADLRERKEFVLLRRVIEARLGHVENPRQRATILAELAEVLSDDLQEPEQALDALLRALDVDPGSAERHDRARALAERLELRERYRDRLLALLENTRRPSDAHARFELLLRLGALAEQEGSDLKLAADYYKQAEDTGVRLIDAWRAGARVAAARGDTETQVRLLGLLSEIGAGEDESRVDALYRVAEIQLADPERVSDGLDALLKALDDEPRFGRASLVLQQASLREEVSERLLEIYEDVARRADDPKLLLHALERRVAQPEASLDLAKEAAMLALSLEAWEQAESLLQRSLELAKGQPLSWALLALARRRMDAGDLAGAVRWLGEATDHGPLSELLPLAQTIAERALADDGDPSLGAKLYERLLERDSASREIWGPLVAIYRRLGDLEKLEKLVSEIVDGIQEPSERNHLRRALAEELLQHEERGDDVTALLRAALSEDPKDNASRDLLTAHLERTGDGQALAMLLRDQLERARDAGDSASIKALTLKIASSTRESEPEQALKLAQSALAEMPEDTELLSLVLDLGAERLDHDTRDALMERLLGLSEGDDAARIARALHQLRSASGDREGALHALQTGNQRAPGDSEIFALLEAHLRESDQFAALATFLQESAKSAATDMDRANMLHEAALLLRDKEDDPSSAALLLIDACAADPGNPTVRLSLANTLALAGDRDAALETIAEGLISTADLAQEVALLRCRASIYRQSGELKAALKDLTEAYSIDPDVSADDLLATLQLSVAEAEAEGREDERELTFRLIDLLLAHSQDVPAREILSAWVSRNAADTEAMTGLWRLDARNENWESVVNICSKLVIMATDELQAEAGIALADASVHLDRSQAARFGLEYVRSKQPENRAIRDKLFALYEQLGAIRELASLLIEDASAQEDPELRLPMLQRAADMLLDHGDRVTLIPVLSEIINLDPRDRESALTLAGVHLQAGNLDQADEIINQIIAGMGSRKSPELGQMFYRKALIARAKGDRNAELNNLQEALICDKDNGLLAAELAELAEVLENWDVAMRVLRTITMMDSGECPISKAEAYARQARIAHRTGDSKRAIFWARRATQEDPELEEAHALLRRLENE